MICVSFIQRERNIMPNKNCTYGEKEGESVGSSVSPVHPSSHPSAFHVGSLLGVVVLKDITKVKK